MPPPIPSQLLPFIRRLSFSQVIVNKDFINQCIYSITQVKMDLTGSLSIILGLLIRLLKKRNEGIPYAFLPVGIGPRACIGKKFFPPRAKALTDSLMPETCIPALSSNTEKPLAIDYGFVLSFKHGVKLRFIKWT